MSITKRFYKENGSKKICYQAQVYIRGVRLKTRTFKTKREALVWHDKEKVFLKGDPSELKRESSLHCFSDCLKIYKKEAVPFLQEPTQKAYQQIFRFLIDSPLYKVKMEHLSARHIHIWISWLKQQPTKQTVFRKSFRTELKFLNTILNWYKNCINEDFNVPITKQHRQACCYKAIPPRRPDYFIKPEAARAWLSFMKENKELPVYWRLASFMLLTGTRVSEACGMCWDVVDLEEGVVRIVRIMRWRTKSTRPYLVEHTKTKSSVRLIKLSDELISMLKEMKLEGGGEGLVFIKNGSEALNYGTIKKVFNRGFKALGLPWRSTHILRHSYATMALIATKDLPSVQASLGHRSSRMTERYAKAVASLSRDTAEKTSEIFNLFGRKTSQTRFIKITAKSLQNCSHSVKSESLDKES